MTLSLHRLAFFDESGINTNLTRRYGRAYGVETMPYPYSALDHRQFSVEYGIRR